MAGRKETVLHAAASYASPTSFASSSAEIPSRSIMKRRSRSTAAIQRAMKRSIAAVERKNVTAARELALRQRRLRAILLKQKSSVVVERAIGGGSAEPQIQSISGPDGSAQNTPAQPGDPVRIVGTGFGSSRGEVHFSLKDANFEDRPAAVERWADNEIIVSVPQWEDVGEGAGMIHVTTANGTKSNTCLLNLRQPVIQKYLTIGREWVRVRKGDEDDQWTGYGTDFVIVEHLDGVVGGFKNDDVFFLDARLINGWTLAKVDFQIDHDVPGESGATLAESHPGTDVLLTKVHWYTSAWHGVSYTIGFKIEGFSGTIALPDTAPLR